MSCWRDRFPYTLSRCSRPCTSVHPNRRSSTLVLAIISDRSTVNAGLESSSGDGGAVCGAGDDSVSANDEEGAFFLLGFFDDRLADPWEVAEGRGVVVFLVP